MIAAFLIVRITVLSILVEGTMDELSLLYNPNHLQRASQSSSCLNFSPQNDTNPDQYTTFRANVTDEEVDFIYVSILAENVICGYDLYVMPLTEPQTGSWGGIWLTCPLLTESNEQDMKACLFRCQCVGGCKQIQVTRRPRSFDEIAWTLCQICLTYTTPDSDLYPVEKRKCHGNISSSIILYPDPYFDIEIHDGLAWLVILRRKDGSVDFNRNATDYKYGFGELTGEYWAGIEHIYQRTSAQPHTLRIDLESYEGEIYYAVYSSFQVGSAESGYRLKVLGYNVTSTADDSLSFHNGMKFSTKDADNDLNEQNCVEIFNASWWFNDCKKAVLTTPYGNYPEIPDNKGITWENQFGKTKFAKFARMMIRLEKKRGNFGF